MTRGGDFDRFVKAGYIVVSQDVRGRNASEGKFLGLWEAQAEDGYDTVEWAAKLPWSNGKAGTFGGSALAIAQWNLAPLRPPSLVVMAAECSPARFYDMFPTRINRPYIYLRSRITRSLPEMRRRANLPGVHTEWEGLKLWKQDSEKWINWLPWLELPQEFLDDDLSKYLLFMKNPHIDPWKLDGGCKDITVPNLDITGWYDFTNGDMLLFRTMVSEAKTEVARKGCRIIIGPWSHTTRGDRRVDNFDFGPNAALDKTAVEIRWFDYWLKGKRNGADKDPPVRIFIMGDNKWRDEQHWPLQRAKEKIFFIASEGHANTPSGDGKLVRQKPEQSNKDQYVYDPNDPVPTLSDISQRLFPRDQRPLADREDILVYETEPLGERVEVTGNPEVVLFAATSASDTDWFLRLIDVAPDGLAVNVSSGVVRARYRHGFDRPELIQPGEVVKYTIRMNHTSNAFLPGHRIRLDITSSDFPNYDRNHNTAVNQNADATLVIANQTIYHGGDQATRILLPWVPNPIEEKPEPKPKVQMYPLHRAAAEGNAERVKLLLSEGTGVNTQDEKKNTPLRRAVESGSMEVVQILVEAGADVNAGSWPPLCVAVDENHMAIAEYLIAHGVDVNAGDGWTALQQAPYVSNNVEMVELLIANGANINAGPYTALHAAVDQDRSDIAELLIAKGANVNAKDKNGMTPLGYALDWNRKDIAELLLAVGASSTSNDETDLTFLHYAAVFGYHDFAEMLLNKGAKIDERDDVYEFTALHYAARFGHKNIAEILIANGANIKAMDKWDYQPIHWAAHHDRADVVELLISKGADINAKTSMGQTPLQLAKIRRNTETIEVLRKYEAKE
ncbi:CocE/NonD family hydrolase [Planctomycetota bacterium]